VGVNNFSPLQSRTPSFGCNDQGRDVEKASCFFQQEFTSALLSGLFDLDIAGIAFNMGIKFLAQNPQRDFF
jgi:hypothetical protein